jgi:hypothetical protein
LAPGPGTSDRLTCRERTLSRPSPCASLYQPDSLNQPSPCEASESLLALHFLCYTRAVYKEPSSESLLALHFLCYTRAVYKEPSSESLLALHLPEGGSGDGRRLRGSTYCTLYCTLRLRRLQGPIVFRGLVAGLVAGTCGGILLQGLVAGTCGRILLQGLVARTCCRDLLQGLVARTCCRDLLQGLVARTCCRDLLQDLISESLVAGTKSRRIDLLAADSRLRQCRGWCALHAYGSRLLTGPADGDRNAELSNANKSFADHRVTGDPP